jgi:hypothetical protein
MMELTFIKKLWENEAIFKKRFESTVIELLQIHNKEVFWKYLLSFMKLWRIVRALIPNWTSRKPVKVYISCFPLPDAFYFCLSADNRHLKPININCYWKFVCLPAPKIISRQLSMWPTVFFQIPMISRANEVLFITPKVLCYFALDDGCDVGAATYELNRLVNLVWHGRTFTSRDSSVGIATGYRLDDWMIGVRLPAGLGIFLFTTVSRMALGPTQPPIR